MIVTSLAADGFKNLEEVLINPHPKLNLITGMNAQGKTNLIEAIWLTTGCRSFRGSKDRDYIGIDKGCMSIGLSFYDGRRKQIISYAMSRDGIKEKRVSLNGVPMKGTGGLFESFKCVVFTPDDIDLIRGGPDKRRSFADLCACQLRHKNLDTVRRYEILLNQRNALLKSIASGRSSADSLSVWDQQVAAIGTAVSQRRCQYIKQLDETCRQLYSSITGGRETLSIGYSSNIFGCEVEEEDKGEFAVGRYFKRLRDSEEDDIRLGYTVWGAHRDDIIIKINGMSIKEYGSQGQKKTAALVLKLGQAEIFYKNRDEAPVILLDDVMGELDESRQKLVFEVIEGMQVFITACNENAVKGLCDGKHYRVENGRVSENGE